jgi:hypothetical protein
MGTGAGYLKSRASGRCCGVPTPITLQRYATPAHPPRSGGGARVRKGQLFRNGGREPEAPPRCRGPVRFVERAWRESGWRAPACRAAPSGRRTRARRGRPRIPVRRLSRRGARPATHRRVRAARRRAACRLIWVWIGPALSGVGGSAEPAGARQKRRGVLSIQLTVRQVNSGIHRSADRRDARTHRTRRTGSTGAPAECRP